MSEVQVTAVTIDAISKHPNADKLDCAKIGEYTVVVGRDEFQTGDIVAFFPPDVLIPPRVAEQLGVAKYLKACVYPGDSVKAHCRVSATRLRGVPSFGFVYKLGGIKAGDDLTGRFKAVKYEPPEPLWWNMTGDNAKDDPRFHVYTNIENYRNSRYKGAFEIGTPVRMTEKIHGTNARTGLIGSEYVCGSHKTIKKEFDASGKRSLYWSPLTDDMRSLLGYFADHYGQNVIAFGEIYSDKIQFMGYGVPKSELGYRLFDVSVGGVYMNWDDIEYASRRFGIGHVPLLYAGPFAPEIVNEFVDGPTTMCKPELITASFKGREGIVITPLTETYSDIMGGRLIAKAISADYLSCRTTDSH